MDILGYPLGNTSTLSHFWVPNNDYYWKILFICWPGNDLYISEWCQMNYQVGKLLFTQGSDKHRVLCRSYWMKELICYNSWFTLKGNENGRNAFAILFCLPPPKPVFYFVVSSQKKLFLLWESHVPVIGICFTVPTRWMT